MDNPVPYDLRNLRVTWNVELLCPWCGCGPIIALRKDARVIPYAV